MRETRLFKTFKCFMLQRKNKGSWEGGLEFVGEVDKLGNGRLCKTSDKVLQKYKAFACFCKHTNSLHSNEVQTVSWKPLRLQRRCLCCLAFSFSSSRPLSSSCPSPGWHRPGSWDHAGRTCSPSLFWRLPEQGSKSSRTRWLADLEATGLLNWYMKKTISLVYEVHETGLKFTTIYVHYLKSPM